MLKWLGCCISTDIPWQHLISIVISFSTHKKRDLFEDGDHTLSVIHTDTVRALITASLFYFEPQTLGTYHDKILVSSVKVCREFFETCNSR